ncbi:MAG TPA: polysaccharide biosynthesis/export family protein [Pyrinomonadaceae bacterium]|nr:polysaccharide biosynthesis/export family protein [Pyrinomonadaceae bacterium]
MYLRSLLVVLVITTATFVVAAQAVAVQSETLRAYLIGPGDELTVKVLGEPQFDFASTVDENGQVGVPFFDQPVVAQCKSEAQLDLELTKLVSKYLKNPELHVRVTDRKSRPPVSLYGEVRNQQQFLLTRRAYLLELLTVAGGESEKSGGMVSVYRTRPPMCGEADQAAEWKAASEGGLGAPSRTYSISSLRQGAQGSNPEIFAGDVIIVHKASIVYVTGEVMKPGELGIPEGGLPLTQAMAMASGITREGTSKNVKIYRRKTGEPKPEVIAVSYDKIKKGLQKDMMLQPYDIVEVGKAKKGIADIMLEIVTGLPNRIPIPRPF